MQLDTIAVISPGDMGQGIGRTLREAGRRVITALDGRSERTRGLAKASGLEDVGTLDEVAAQADLILSVMPPAAATGFAREATGAMRRCGRAVPFADLNAVSPMTATRIAGIIGAVDAPFIDGGIVGFAPGKGARPARVYLSGTLAPELAPLETPQMSIRPIGPEIGRASAFKMMYAGLTKATWALQANVLMAAERMGLTDELHAEFADSQADSWAKMEGWIGLLAADSGRWWPELEEIADTFKAAGVPDGFHRAAANVYRLLDGTPLAAETRETWDRQRPLKESIRVFVEALPPLGGRPFSTPKEKGEAQVNEIESPQDLKNWIGKELGVSDWVLIDQARINKFAEATGDFQWIHVDEERAKTEMPGGKTIAHGYLTLSLIAGLKTFDIKNKSRGINYGSNRVRFTNTVPVGSRVRLRQVLKNAEDVANSGVRMTLENQIEIEGQDKPACVAETMGITYS